jgi:broad specificity phosphatase PhoE
VADSALVLCRHGATAVNVEKRFLSTSDPPLCSVGRDQCERLREALNGFRFERCLVSPMRRALETREIAAPAVPFEVDDALREVDFGSFEGKSLEWLETNAPDLLAHRRRDPVDFRPPGGESIRDAAGRVRPLAARLRAERSALVIGHRVTLGILERLLRDLPLDSKFVEPLEPAEFRIVDA